MKKKIFTLALLLVMSVTGSWAQNLPGSIWSSPQSTTTEGRYRSNADDFIRPDAYSGLKLDKWFGMVSFLWDSDGDSIATAGFAAQANNVYLGAFYSGNFWAGAPVNDYIEKEFATAPAGGVTGKKYDAYGPFVSVRDPNRPVNNFALLVGIADMGFRLTYRTDFQLFDKSDIVVGNTPTGSDSGQLYKNYREEYGYMAPQIAWSMAKDLTGNGIRPYATFDLVFDRDNKKVETTGADADGNTGGNTSRSANHVDPSFGAGMGGYTFYNQNGFKGSFDVDYVLTMKLYNNEYSYDDGGKYKTDTIKGTYNPGNFPGEEISYVSNLLTPSLSGSWSRDRLALKFKLNLPLTLVNEESRLMGHMMIDDGTGTMVPDPSNKKLVYHSNSDTTTTFSFRPDLRLALQYKLVPDRLTLNLGARIQATAINLETVDHKSYNYGTEQTNLAETRHSKSFGDKDRFVSRFHIGPTFYFTENAWIEATTGITNRSGDDAIRVFESADEGGLFNFGSIMVGLKF